jgi:Tfp pilus assembly protein PilV
VNEGGFTVIEVIVAVLVLTIGVTALVGSSALVTRQVGRGRIVTIANQLATQKLEELRRAAARRSGGNRCADAGFASGGPSTVRSVTLQWTVATSGTARQVSVTASYPRQGGTSSFTLTTIVGCY